MRTTILATPLAAALLFCIATPPGFAATSAAQSGSAASSIQRQTIERIMEQDTAAGRNGTSAVEIAAMIRAIDLRGAPADFREAYGLHIRAWEQASIIERLLAKGVSGTALPGIEVRESAAQREISTTFDRVQEIARRYGASLPDAPETSSLNGVAALLPEAMAI